MIVWASLWAFVLVVPIVAALWWRWWRRKDMQGALRFSSLKALRGVARGVRARLAGLPTLLKVAAMVLAVIALARPQRADTKIKRNVEGHRHHDCARYFGFHVDRRHAA
jgi:Ca-activated chloride channel homolog